MDHGGSEQRRRIVWLRTASSGATQGLLHADGGVTVALVSGSMTCQSNSPWNSVAPPLVPFNNPTPFRSVRLYLGRQHTRRYRHHINCVRGGAQHAHVRDARRCHVQVVGEVVVSCILADTRPEQHDPSRAHSFKVTELSPCVTHSAATLKTRHVRSISNDGGL